MSTTQIPPRDPTSPPPPKPAPRSSGAELYDPNHWEDAYRNSEVFDPPKLLLDLQDELTRSRRREAFWISVAAHVVLFAIFWNSDKFIRFFPTSHTPLTAPNWMKQQDTTFLELPADAQRLTKRPDTKIISDKDRLATHSTPLDPKELQKIIQSARAGNRGPVAPPGEEQRSQAAAQNAPGPNQPSAPREEHTQPRQELAEVKPSPEGPKVQFGGTVSAGTAVEQAARAAATNRGGYPGDAGDNGLTRGRQGGVDSGLDVLSDTMGVDFGPYLTRILHDIRKNWYTLIPESARSPLYKKGTLSIDFVILKEGKLSDMQRSSTSGDIALDRAAWGSITNSNPFPPLPSDFQGNSLSLRIRFYYNPDGKDLLR
jgi:outer membrane biosynthesis protein TonB